MDKNVIKIIGLLVVLIVIVAAILFIAIEGVDLKIVNAISIADVSLKGEDVEKAKESLALAESQYEVNMQTLETAKKEFNDQKEAYELISDETLNAVKEATKEEEYFIEYLWIVLGNYATAHNLDLAVIEPGGTVGQEATSNSTTDDTTVTTGTGVTGTNQGVNSTTNAATTGSPTSGTQKDATETENTVLEESVTTGLTSSADALKVQVKGSYIDLADFVFEVENDKSLRFRLDNIQMRSAGGTQVITSFDVKDFTVLKSLE